MKIISWIILASFYILFTPNTNATIKIKLFDMIPRKHKVFMLKATYYNNTESQCDDSPYITANNTNLRNINLSDVRYVAMSRDMIQPTQWHSVDSGYNPNAPFCFGDTIEVKQSGAFDGRWIVVDSMNRRHKKAIDFLVEDEYIKFDSGMEVEIFKVNI